MTDTWPPDYAQVFLERQDRLLKLRANPALWTGAKEYYRTRLIAFVEHWCITIDPRNVGTHLPVVMPFTLFPKQREFLRFLEQLFREQQAGLVEKSRDMGATWLCCAFSLWLWLFYDGAALGWGSRKQEYVDQLGDPKSIFQKLRDLIWHLPREFWPIGLNPQKHMTMMRLINPENGSTIIGECGDHIGRGGRTLIYFKDESAHYEHPELIEAALMDNTRIQIDISSVNGLGNVFHRRREAGIEWSRGQPIVKDKTNVFVMDWSDHPAKTPDWYNGRRQKAIDDGLLHLFAQEVERNYSAALSGVIIPAEWVAAAIDAHLRLDFDDSGGSIAGLDVADEGLDKNALAIRKGVVLKHLDLWGERDTGRTTRRAIDACAGHGSDLMPVEIQYDSVGVGAGVKAETNRLAEEKVMPRTVRLVPWNAGAAVLNPEGFVVEHDRQSPRNKEFYKNLKAQGWWMLRRRFERTWRALNEEDFTWKAAELISLPSNLPHLRTLQKELSQPTMIKSSDLKLIVDKTPEGTSSPNLADAVMMAFWPVSKGPFVITPYMLERAREKRR